MTSFQKYRLAKKRLEKKQARHAIKAKVRLEDRIERKVQNSSKHRKIKIAKTYLTANTIPGLSEIVKDPTLSGTIRLWAAQMILDAGHGTVDLSEPRRRPRARKPGGPA